MSTSSGYTLNSGRKRRSISGLEFNIYPEGVRFLVASFFIIHSGIPETRSLPTTTEKSFLPNDLLDIEYYYSTNCNTIQIWS